MIAKFFIDRPVFAGVLSIIIAIAGLVALRGLPVAQYPDIVPPQVVVNATYPGASAEVIASTVAAPLEQQINGVPGLMQLPILGALFKSRDYVNNQTELVVIVTPYVVRAVAQKQLSRPDDGFADPSDPSTVLLGRLNRIYGSSNQPAATPAGAPQSKYGFILD